MRYRKKCVYVCVRAHAQEWETMFSWFCKSINFVSMCYRCSADAYSFTVGTCRTPDGWGALMWMISPRQIERHQSQMTFSGSSTEIHPFIHSSKRGTNTPPSAKHTLMLRSDMQKLYILTFAIVSLCMRALACGHEGAEWEAFSTHLSGLEDTHIHCSFLGCFTSL